jgi:NADH-quinone oxidoreductase subunit F
MHPKGPQGTRAMKSFDQLRRQARKDWRDLWDGGRPVVTVGTATCGRSAGALETLAALEEECAAQGVDVRFLEAGCIGMCHAEPLVGFTKPGGPTFWYGEVTPRRVPALVKAVFGNGEVETAGLLGATGKRPPRGVPSLWRIQGLRGQKRRVLKNCGIIDPSDLGHAVANGAYTGFMAALKGSPEGVLDEVKNAGLRGRGGAGFPTWRKWQFCREAPGTPKYLICNADEGDPGAFMNRSLLEGDPHSVLEGMLIAGYAIGASVGYIYCRAEYPLALERLRHALAQLHHHGLLGHDIGGSGFSFDLRLKEGAGAFVCGEETALIASIEGKRGSPRTRPPYPAVSGLWGKPTVINNVETLASTALVMRHGADWYASQGTERSKGTKTFSLVGKVNRPGLIEVPLGMPLRTVVQDIGGGVPDGGAVKAVQTGGPSGGCIPAHLLDLPLDYEALGEVGSIMGSGGMVVMDGDTCMVDVARFFLRFTERESCGKCVPCRLGTKQMLAILDDIAEGRGRPGDIELLEELGKWIQVGSLCGLGQTAPNPVASTIRYFRDEYEAHVHGKTCNAGVCKELISYHIEADRCVGCTVCMKECPVGAITGSTKEVHFIDQELCTRCGACMAVCPKKADAVVRLPGRQTAALMDQAEGEKGRGPGKGREKWREKGVAPSR